MSKTPVILRLLVDDVSPVPQTPFTKIAPYVMHDTAYRDPLPSSPGGFRRRDQDLRRKVNSSTARSGASFSDLCKTETESQRPSKFKESTTELTRAQEYLKTKYPYLATPSRYTLRPNKLLPAGSAHTYFTVTPKRGLARRTSVLSSSTSPLHVQPTTTSKYYSSGETCAPSPFNGRTRPISIEHYTSPNTPCLVTNKDDAPCAGGFGTGEPDSAGLPPSARGGFNSGGRNLITPFPSDRELLLAPGMSRNLAGSAMARRFMNTAAGAAQGAGNRSDLKQQQQQCFMRELDAKGKKRLLKEYSGRSLQDLLSPTRIGNVRDIADAYDNLVNWNLARMYRSIGDNGELCINPPEMPVHMSLGDLNDAALGQLAVHSTESTRPKAQQQRKPWSKYSVNRFPQMQKIVSGPGLTAMYEDLMSSQGLDTHTVLPRSSPPEKNAESPVRTPIKKPQRPRINRSNALSRETVLMREKVEEARGKYRKVRTLAEQCDDDLTRKRFRDTDAQTLGEILREHKKDADTLMSRYYKVKKLLFEDKVNVVNAMNRFLWRKRKQRVKPLLDMKPFSVNTQMRTEVSREKADAYLSRLYYESKKDNIRIGETTIKTVVHRLV